MTPIRKRKLIQTYIEGWKENNSSKIVEPLSEDCTIIESHGPTYFGKEQVKKWFAFWEKEKAKVLQWDILSFYSLDKENAAFFEWDFACNFKGQTYHLPGISLVKFHDNKITYIHEYRMTQKAYNWMESNQNPE